MSDSDTICALSSGAGRAAVAVIRVSGDRAEACTMGLLCGPLPAARQATLAGLHDPDTGETIDRGLVLWFPAPRSFTGEDCAEFQVHGGPAVVRSLLRVLCAFPGVRLAEPGEFTRRAFLNGRLDLTQVEGLADLIEAETEVQRRQARRQSEGELARLYDSWREALLRVLANLEADIDFADEDLPEGLGVAALGGLEGLVADLDRHLAGSSAGRVVREGLRVAIVGPPNAGKSSLLNVLAGRDAAIVSTQAGTTRDVVEVHLELEGLAVLLADTAGLRESEDRIEQEGMRRALQWSRAADVNLLVLDAGGPPPTADLLDLAAGSFVFVNKTDLHDLPDWAADLEEAVFTGSVATGTGLEPLIGALKSRVRDLAGSDDRVLPTRERHAVVLASCREALEAARSRPEVDLRAEELRRAVRSLERLTGRIDVEDILDRLFKEFCIGK